MDIRSVARLALVSAAASGVLVLAGHLDTGAPSGTATSATGVTPRGAAGATRADATITPARTAEPAGSQPTGARTRLEQALRRAPARHSAPAATVPVAAPVDESLPHTHSFDAQRGGPVSSAGAPDDLGELGPLHVDPMPPGRSVHDPVDTRTLLERADLDAGLAADDAPITAGATAPVGTPSIKTLTSHVLPSCSGTGTDGNRVQVVYAHEAGKTDRYADVLSILRNEVANVDDAFALSAQQTGGERRVRWVHDSSCLPVIADVTLPVGSLGSDFDATMDAMDALGYNKPSRKYLVFADANAFCGIGTLYDIATPTGNPNDGAYASYSRVDANCWSSTGHSVAAHELTHNLGGVLSTAPHATKYGHCHDDADLMCYKDGPETVMQTNVCPSAQEQLLDCNHDDYFDTNPAAGSFLDKYWNTARSSFLDKVVTSAPPPDVAVSADAATTLTGQSVRFTATSSKTVSWAWSRSSTACSVTPRTSGQADLVCPSSVAGTVTVTATATESGTGATGSGTASVTVAKAPAPTAVLSVPTDAADAQPFPVSVTPGGIAPFTYAWTAATCTVATPTAASASVTCAGGSTARDVTVTAVVRQADGQSVSSSATVRVPASANPSPPPPPTSTPVATSWSTPTVLSSTVRARLRDAKGTALPGRAVTLQVKWAGTSTWRTALQLKTDSTGLASVRVSSSSAGWFRFTSASDAAYTGSVSSAVYLKVTTSLRMAASGNRLVGTLRASSGDPVAGALVVLQRRAAGSSRWVRVVRLTTSELGRVSNRVNPSRRTSYRWVFAGETTHLRAHSPLRTLT